MQSGATSRVPAQAPGSTVPPVRQLRRSLLTLAMMAGLEPYAARAQSPGEVEFDRTLLARRGLDPALAELFRTEARFAPGEREVTVVVNGRRRGRARLRFDAHGEAHLDATFLAAMRLRTAVPLAELDPDADGFVAMQAAWPQGVVKLEPAQQQVSLVLAQDALVAATQAHVAYEGGGAAALLNYAVSASSLRSAARTRTSFSGSTETGFNAADWMVRSHQSIRRNQGTTRVRQLDTYAQRSLPGSGRLLQLGELQVSSPLFPGASVRGVQLLPDDALAAPQAASSAVVDGIAGSEARVEIFQNGVLLHDTLVPPGPFQISGFALRDVTADLEVVVHEGDGERRFTVPAGTFRRASVARPGTTFAAGQRRSRGVAGRGDGDALVTASGAWRLPTGDAVASAGFLATAGYQTVAVGLDQALHGDTQWVISARSTAALASRDKRRGVQNDVWLTTGRSGLGVNLGLTHRSAGYLDLHEAGAEQPTIDNRLQWQGTAGLSWTTAGLGTFNASVSPWRTFSGTTATRISAGWSRMFGRASVRASLEQSQGRAAWRGQRDRSAQLSLSLPLGSSTVRASVRQRDDLQRLALDANLRTAGPASWRLSAEQDVDGGNTRVGAGVAATTRYVELSANLTHAQRTTLASAQLRGALVAHREGVTPSPYRVGDTFGIARAGDRAGVRIRSDAGDAWTDARGRAVLARLRPYQSTRIQVDGRTLPRNVDIDNGARVLQLRRGAVSHLTFDLVSARRAMLTVTDSAGQALAKGGTVLANGEFLTAVVEGGRIYLADYQPGMTLQVNQADGSQCQLQVQLPEHADPTAFIETGTGRCLPQ